jgi:hypothetical protein
MGEAHFEVDGVGLAGLREQLAVLKKDGACRLVVIFVLVISQEAGCEHEKTLFPVLDNAALLRHAAAEYGSRHFAGFGFGLLGEKSV